MHKGNYITICKRKLNQNIKKFYRKKSLKYWQKKLAIDDRIRKMEEIEVYITVKDHKEGFSHQLSFRLINPSKPDIDKINKNLFDKINNK